MPNKLFILRKVIGNPAFSGRDRPSWFDDDAKGEEEVGGSREDAIFEVTDLHFSLVSS